MMNAQACAINVVHERVYQPDAGNLSIWDFLPQERKLKPEAMQLGKVVRTIDSVSVTPDDNFLYAGTRSGDLLQVNLQRNVLRCTGPKPALPGGITCCAVLPGTELILVGSGEGLLGLMHGSAQVRQAHKATPSWQPELIPSMI
jgi:cilia- and flagella-associated protein 52